MNLGKTLVDLATAPVRVGLAVAETGLDMANGASGWRSEPWVRRIRRARAGSGSVAHMLGIDDAVERANRLARLMDEDQPLGRALAPGGPVDRLLAPGGVVDKLTVPGGVLDRMTQEDGGLMRAIEPGGLVDQLLDEDGLVERLLAEDGLADRLLAEGGLVDKLTARHGPLEQLADVADTLNRLAPGLEALEPTIEALREAVIVLSQVVNPLSNIADRIPFPGRRPRAVVVDAGDARSGSSTPTSDPINSGPAGLLSSVVERSPCKRNVIGSIPIGGSTRVKRRLRVGGRS